MLVRQAERSACPALVTAGSRPPLPSRRPRTIPHNRRRLPKMGHSAPDPPSPAGRARRSRPISSRRLPPAAGRSLGWVRPAKRRRVAAAAHFRIRAGVHLLPASSAMGALAVAVTGGTPSSFSRPDRPRRPACHGLGKRSVAQIRSPEVDPVPRSLAPGRRGSSHRPQSRHPAGLRAGLRRARDTWGHR